MARFACAPETQPPAPVLEYDLVVEHCGHRLRIRGTETMLSAEPQSLRSAWHYFQIFLRSRRSLATIPALKIYWKRIRIW